MNLRMYLLVAGFCLWNLTSLAATTVAEANDLPSTAEEKTDNPKAFEYRTNPNIAKINFTSLAFKNVSLQYERILTRKTSVALGFRFMPSTGIPLAATISSLVNDESAELQKFIDDTKVSGFAITPEFRYYFGKSAGKGLYIAPFLRYEKFNITTVQSIDLNSHNYDINFDGSHSSTGVGLMLGSQFRLSKNFTLDWWIAGPYIHKSNTKINASNFKISDEDYEEFKSYINDFTLEDDSPLNFKIETSVSQTNAEIKASFNSLWIRSFGLCLGYKF